MKKKKILQNKQKPEIEMIFGKKKKKKERTKLDMKYLERQISRKN